MIHIQGGFTGKDRPLWHTRVGYDSIARRDEAVIVASSNNDAEGFAEAAATDLTYEWWRPEIMPATWQIDSGDEYTRVDYAAVAVHDMGTKDCDLQVEHSDDGEAWTTLFDVEVEDDTPLLFLFEPVIARYWRIQVEGLLAPRIGVIYIGEVLELERPVRWMGHSPGVLSRVTRKMPQRSIGGQRLGTSVIREGLHASFSVHNLTEAWYRSDFDPLVQHMRRMGYFLAWRPTQFSDVLFGWTDDDVAPSNAGGGVIRRMDVAWEMQAHAGSDVDKAPWGFLAEGGS